MELIDTHCHLDFPAFADDLDAVLDASRAAGVRDFVIPGVVAEDWPGVRELCAAHADLHATYGLHPGFLADHAETHLEDLEAALARGDAVAVGEIGLDFYIDAPDREGQQALFEAQLAIAADAGLPVLLHVRKAHDEVLAALRRSRVERGIAHAFNGSLQQAGQYLDLGFRLGFGGMLTFERSRRLRRLARELPIEAVVLETDAPDLTVASHRGERNSPAYLPEVCEALAEVRGRAPDEMARQTTRNAREVLGLPA
ncbi:MAG: TatD family hydrolase [Gammaproteobacteria bacterium]|nr:TatD family hydrolase [Gammaproteobacteria bacterium]